jgi:hypothetical protein
MSMPDGTDTERITDNLVLDAFSDLRPDGKRIVFAVCDERRR